MNKNFEWQDCKDGFRAVYTKTGFFRFAGKKYAYRSGEVAFVTNNKKAFSKAEFVFGGGVTMFISVFASHNIFSGLVIFERGCQLTVLDNDDTLNIRDSIFSGNCNVLVTDFNGVWDCDIEKSIVNNCEIINSHIADSVVGGMQINRSKVKNIKLLCPNVAGNQWGHIVQINRENVSPMGYYPYSEKTNLVMINDRIISVTERMEIPKETIFKMLDIPEKVFDEAIEKAINILEDADCYVMKDRVYMQVIMALYEYYVEHKLLEISSQFVSHDIVKHKVFATKGVITRHMLSWLKKQEDVDFVKIEKHKDLIII